MKRSSDDLWSRIRQARLVEVLLLYLGASWAILEGIQLLRETFQLPLWVGPTAFILLVVGLVVILGTAWVQSHPLADRREQLDEVPGSWELDLGDLRTSLAQGRLPHLTWSRVLLGGTFAFALLFGFAGVYVLFQDRGRSLIPDPLVASEAAPGIAVLPFDVSGSDPENWRDGMIVAVAKNLDGVAGLRAIESRTVLARWREGVAGEASPDAATALEVARRTGARYAVLGSLVIAGDRLRAVAGVHDLETGSRLGEAQVDGAADSVITVVDQFSGEVLRQIVGERGEIPPLDLARATTASLPALRAYLEGETLFRGGRYEDAIPAYRQAVEADSTFALAWMRLGLAYGWISQFDMEREATVRARRLADRLPERDALLLRGSDRNGRLETLEGLRTAIRRYPDDPLAWYLFGEFVIHQGAAFLIHREEGQQAFDRAIALDPSFAPAYIHAIDYAMAIGPDSARAADLSHNYQSLTEQAALLQTSQALAFGDESTRTQALAAIDSVKGTRINIAMDLGHPRFLEVQTAVVEAAFRSKDPLDDELGPWYRAWHRLAHGRVEAGFDALEDRRVEGDRVSLAYRAHASRLPVPEERLERVLTRPSTKTAPSAVTDRADIEFVQSAWALEQDRRADYDQARRALEQLAEEAMLAGDTVVADQTREEARALDGFAAWQAGQPEEAERILEEARLRTVGRSFVSNANSVIRWWLAWLSLESGKHERAAELFLSLSHGRYPGVENAIAVFHLAKVQEQLGRLDEARANYEWFVLAYRDADPELRPLVQDATARLLQLKSEAD